MSGRLAQFEEGEEVDDSMVTVDPEQGTPVEDMKGLATLWRVKMTQVQMMEDRGYELTDLAVELKERAVSPEEFWKLMLEKLPGLDNPKSKTCSPTALWDLLTETYISKQDSQICNLVVFLPRPQGKAFPTVRLNRVIAVVKRDPTLRYLDVIYEFPMRKLEKTKLSVTNRVVAEWSYSDLLMPIHKSVYVGGKFRVLTPQEFQEYYKADPVAALGGLPSICKDDPLARYYQWTVDTVVRSIEIGDVNVAVTHLIKDYVVSNNTIFTAIDTAEQPAAV